MSDELKAAKERLRRIRNHDSITSVYDFPGRKLTIEQQWQLDCERLIVVCGMLGEVCIRE